MNIYKCSYNNYIMPYNNLPKSKWIKMEHCVKEIKEKGEKDLNPYAVCHKSIMCKHKGVSNEKYERNE